jgi:hypothetical protein
VPLTGIHSTAVQSSTRARAKWEKFVAPIDNEYVRRVGFAMSLSHDGLRTSCLKPFARLAVVTAVVSVATALLVFAAQYCR